MIASKELKEAFPNKMGRVWPLVLGLILALSVFNLWTTHNLKLALSSSISESNNTTPIALEHEFKSKPDEQTVSTELADKVFSLEQSVEKLEEVVESINISLDEFYQTQISPAPEDDLLVKDDQLEDQAYTIDPAQLMQQRVATYDNFIQETNLLDPTWSLWAEVEVANLLSELPQLSISENRSVKCSGAACRIDVTIPQNKLSGAEEGLFDIELMHKLAYKGLTSASHTTEQSADGSVRKIFYMPRKGYKLPQIPMASAPTSDQ